LALDVRAGLFGIDHEHPAADPLPVQERALLENGSQHLHDEGGLALAGGGT
jgi:hypothetical protein